MSPDERSVLDTFTSAARRVRIAAVVEALAWAGVAAALSVFATLPVLAVVLAWRLQSSRRTAIVATIEQSHPDARNVFVTADELLRGLLSAKPEVRGRVFARAAIESRRLDPKAFGSRAPIAWAALAAGAAWVLVLTSAMWRPSVERLAGGASAPGMTSQPGILRVTVSLTPPVYTGRPATRSVDPGEIREIEGTVASIAIGGSATRVAVEQEGVTRNLARNESGEFTDRVELRKTGYYAIDTDTGSRRVIPIVVTPDALPAVRVTVPGRDLVFPRVDRRVEFDVQATDDLGLRGMALEYTKVSGSGEQFEFQEGLIPLALAKTSDRQWRGTATRALAGLGLAEGDILVYRAAATDARPGDGTARSDAFFIEISSLAAAAGDAFTVPEEETRYALSQQMLIIKTERLDRSRSSMAPEKFTDAALNLAVEQRMIRAEFVFMLGGEVEDEEVEAQQSTELQEGRLQNRGQRDVRAATVAMSQAEKLLTGGSTREALAAERAAVAALQRAFARDRYILRALGSRTALDPKRRLSGSLADAAGRRRDRPLAPSNRRAALLQDLLGGLAALGDPSAVATANPTTLAREALRIDADSAVLRQAAADLQRLSDNWPATSVDARKSAVDAVSAAIAGEAAKAMAAAPMRVPFAAPALAGGFADALRAGGSK